MQRGAAWAAVTSITEGQWGLVTTAQAETVGVGALEVSRLNARGDLERIAHGVYRVRGSAPVEFLELRAAWLQLAPALFADQRLSRPELGVVSHASAARVQHLGDLLGDEHEFSTAQRRRTSRSDVRIWKSAVPAEDLLVVDGLLVTTPLRTILDLLAAGEDGGHVGTVLVDAERAGTISRGDLASFVRRAAPDASRYGASSARALLPLLRMVGSERRRGDLR